MGVTCGDRCGQWELCVVTDMVHDVLLSIVEAALVLFAPGVFPASNVRGQ